MFGAYPIYAYDGPPFIPFFTWAAQCDALSTSPLEFFVHPNFGTWHAYLAVLLDRSLIESASDGPLAVHALAGGAPGNDLVHDHVQGEGCNCSRYGCGSRLPL